MTTTANMSTAPVPGQNVNSKPFTSQLTRTNPLPPQAPVNQNNNATARYPSMGFNPAIPPNSLAQQQGFNNKFNTFAGLQQPTGKLFSLLEESLRK